MRRRSLAAHAVWILASLGLLVPEGALAATTALPLPAVTTSDVVMGPRGTLQGAVVSPQGTGLGKTRVMVVQGPGRMVNTLTDRQGGFLVSGLRPGVHVIAAAGAVKSFRLWAPGTAPPAASQGVLIVSNEAAVRGQEDWYPWVSEHYVFFCCGVATAIVVPCAVVDANQHRPPVSN